MAIPRLTEVLLQFLFLIGLEQIKPKKTVWRFLKKLKLELPYKPAIPFLGIYPKEIQTLCQRDICTPVFAAALFATTKTWKQPKHPLMDECMKKV